MHVRLLGAVLGAAAIWSVSLPALAQLVVHSARWEVMAGSGENCDATPQVARVCNGQRNCQVPVQAQNLCGGDPAYGKLKVLDIHYSCNGQRQQSVGFPDGAMAALRCDNNPRQPQLQIRSARWEVIGGGPSCDAIKQVGRGCNGKDQCTVLVDARYVCGFDPAYGSLKQLVVNYSCNNGRSYSAAAYPDGSLAQIGCRPEHIQQPRQSVEFPPQHGRAQLQVLEARWEAIGGGGWCDATRQMAAQCDGKHECDVPVAVNYLCNGDPAYGKQKRLDVRFACNGVQQPVLGFVEGSTAQLRCNGHGNVAPVRPGGSGTQVGGNPNGSGLYVTNARWQVNGGGAWCDATPQMFWFSVPPSTLSPVFLSSATIPCCCMRCVLRAASQTAKRRPETRQPQSATRDSRVAGDAGLRTSPHSRQRQLRRICTSN